jgi:hypothetical protein
MSKNENLQELLNEAFHTYQLYLKCVGVDIGGISHLSLLKWPDAVQSALNYAETIAKIKKTGSTEMLTMKKKLMFLKA